MNEFKTQVDLDLMLNDQGNHDVLTKQVNLRWSLELEMRQYGVKSFIVTVPDQTFTVSLNVWGDDDEDTEKEITLEAKDIQVVMREDGISNMIPSTLECYKGKWRLVF